MANYATKSRILTGADLTAAAISWDVALQNSPHFQRFGEVQQSSRLEMISADFASWSPQRLASQHSCKQPCNLSISKRIANGRFAQW